MPLLRWIPAALCLALCMPAALALNPPPATPPAAAPAAVGDWRPSPEFRTNVLREAGYRAIKEHYPDDYARIDAALAALASRGGSTDDAIATLRYEVHTVVMQKAAAASDEAVVRMTRSVVAVVDAVRQRDPEGCHSLLFGDGKGSLESLAALPDSMLTEMQESAAAVIASSRLAPRTAPTEEAVMDDIVKAMTPVYEEYGDQLDRFDAPDATPEERALKCTITLDSYRGILTLPSERAGPVLRLMFSPEDAPPSN